MILDKIVILDEALINKIAAGEVIERPASIVKELIENSIDAGAKKIFIELKEAGKSLIKITDDGAGMSKNDARLSWQRHATSKIKNANDLFSIHTLGFRGEALASIAAVSSLAITTREDDSVSGSKITIRAGVLVSEEDAGCPKGTEIEVKDLFFNTPARKKYLMAMEAEMPYVTDIVTRYAMINPGIHFKLVHNGRELINYPSTRDWLSKINFIYGSRVSRELISVDSGVGNFHITGFISKPVLSKSTKDDQAIYVNKRFIKKNNTISSAINDAYHTLMMVNRYPVAIINIDVPAEKTDVNVHPQKSEIRIQHEKELYQAVFDSVKLSLGKNDIVPEVLKEETDRKLREFSPAAIADYIANEKEKKHIYPVEDTKQQLLVKEDDTAEFARLPEMKILGIVNKTYIIAETEGNLFLIDQHAAAERILYEKFSEQLKAKKVDIQEILTPELVEVTPKQFSLAVQNLDFLSGLGYKIEEFGNNTLLVRAIPVILGRQFDKLLFIDFIEELSEKNRPETLESFFHAKIARMSCRTAIKAGDDITLPQIKKYIQGLDDAKVYTCPHGRPIMIKWSFYELEKMFKRVV